jgi:hypothetical protein
MRRFAVVSCAALSLFLGGCIQSSTLVKLMPDGSGTVEQTLTMSAQAMAQLSALAAMGDQKEGKEAKETKDLTKDPFSEADARAAAAKMGEGVTFVSSEKIDTPDRKGRRAVYAFKDIRKLSLQEMNAPSEAGGGAEMAPKDPPMTFKFEQLPGGHGLLTILNTAAAKAGTSMPDKPAAPLKADESAQAMQMMKAFMGGLKVDVGIQVGKLVKTNIPYVSGGTVTLLSMDFDKALAEPALLEKLQQAKTLADTKAALKGAQGFKVNLDPELKIEFAGK